MSTALALVTEKSLTQRNAQLLRRREELIAVVAKQPKKIMSEEGVVDVGGVLREVRAALSEFEAERVAQKAPYLEGGRFIDKWFKQVMAPLESALPKLLAPINAWQDRIEEQRRREEEAAAEAAREEADRLAKITAKKRATDEDVAAAADAEVGALAAEEQLATATAADRVRVVSDDGSIITRTSRWEGTITSRQALDLEALRTFFTDDCLQKALNAFVRGGGRELRGAKIELVKSATVR